MVSFVLFSAYGKNRFGILCGGKVYCDDGSNFTLSEVKSFLDCYEPCSEDIATAMGYGWNLPLENCNDKDGDLK